jgi:FixJ family two-component response regulator
VWRSDGTYPSGGPTAGGPQTGAVRSKPSSRSQALPVHARESCSAQQRQQQFEGGIKAALQLLQRRTALEILDGAVAAGATAARVAERMAISLRTLQRWWRRSRVMGTVWTAAKAALARWFIA